MAENPYQMSFNDIQSGVAEYSIITLLADFKQSATRRCSSEFVLSHTAWLAHSTRRIG